MSTLQEHAHTRSVAFYTLGCKTNQLESSALADEFRHHGWSIRSFQDEASLYIINTCTVTTGGDSESRRMIRKAKRQNPDARIAVTGCYAQVAPQDVAAIDGVNYVIGNNFKQDIYRIIREMPAQGDPLILVSEMDKSRVMAGASVSAINRTRASLKIQDGCDFKCTYCIIWVARGPSRSLGIGELKDQLGQLVAHGHQEIVLTGINIGQYEDPETHADLAGLLAELVQVPGAFRLRLSSLDPAEVTPELLKLMAESPKICPYLHLSMQSAEDHVLKRMARRHRVADLVSVCEAIQSAIPHCAIGADIITGFPEETDERFESTYRTLEQLPLSYFHTFTYSKRPDTPAADFPDQVPEEVKKERTRRLIALSEQKNLHYRQHLLNKTVQVVVEERGDRGMSEQLVSIQLDQTGLPQNSLVTVQVTSVTSLGTRGQVVNPVQPLTENVPILQEGIA